MTTIRRQLRLWVAAWLVFQSTSLLALVPLDCCAAHRPQAATAKHNCHEKTPVTHCPMPAADGTPCPMHRVSQPASEDECVMRGACDGPAAALASLVSQPGILVDAYEMAPDRQVRAVPIPPREHLIRGLRSPDSPPPRA